MGTNDRELADTYKRLRQRQLALLGRERSLVDDRVDECLLGIATVTMADDGDQVPLRALSLPTGWGKTTASLALLAAIYRLGGSAAFIAPTTDNADEAAGMLDRLLGPGHVLQSDWRVNDGARSEQARHEQGWAEPAPNERVYAERRRQARLLVTTAEKWRQEAERGRDWGVRFYAGHWRDLIVIDESPGLVEVESVTIGEVEKVQQRYARQADLDDALDQVILNMTRVRTEAERGVDYLPAAIVTPDLREVLEPFRRELYVVDKLCHAATGMVFYDALQKAFFIYRLKLKDGEAGPGPHHLLLDATADLSSVVALLPGVEMDRTNPRGDYRHLTIQHVNLPAGLSYKRGVEYIQANRKAFIRWAQTVVERYSQPGEQILLVTWKGLYPNPFDPRPLSDGFLPIAEQEPVALWGRRAMTAHYGDGIGSNAYRACTTVFLLGEYYLPGSTTIGTVHGYRRLRFETPVRWVQRRGYGSELPEPYHDEHQRHMLRHAKQMAARGCMRAIQPDGTCTPMRLVTTMPKPLLLSVYQTLWPRAARPIFEDEQEIQSDLAADNEQAKRVLLAELLRDQKAESYSVPDLARRTGLDRLTRTLQTPYFERLMAQEGWVLEPGQRGRGRAGRLVRSRAFSDAPRLAPRKWTIA